MARWVWEVPDRLGRKKEADTKSASLTFRPPFSQKGLILQKTLFKLFTIPRACLHKKLHNKIIMLLDYKTYFAPKIGIESSNPLCGLYYVF